MIKGLLSLLFLLALCISVKPEETGLNQEKNTNNENSGGQTQVPEHSSWISRAKRGGIMAKPFDIAFRGSDSDGDGFLNEQEFGVFLQKINAKVSSSEFLKKVLQYWDKDQDGLISYSEAVFGNMRFETGNGLLEGNQEDENK